MTFSKLLSTLVLSTVFMSTTFITCADAKVIKGDTVKIPELKIEHQVDLQNFINEIIERDKLIKETYKLSQLNPNVLLPLKPTYILTKDDLKAYAKQIKVNITRADAYKMLNTINNARIKNNKDILRFTSDLLIESSALGKDLATQTLAYYNQDCDKYLYVIGPQTVDDALVAFFKNPENVSTLTSGDYSQIGVGCTYNGQMGENAKIVYNWVITLNH